MYDRIAHYKIIKPLGEGAMGSVLQGFDDALKMTVAIKVLSPNLASDPENLARFELEARAAANLKHPNIAHVFFVGRTEDGLPFYAMEYIDGIALNDVINDRMRMTGRQMLEIMCQTCSALQFATDKEILHRDIKPGNIMLETEGGAKLVDFGMAKIADTDTTLTSTGVALGTPNYISPEQARGDDIDFRADMYSLGITFFELATGKPPYEADSPVAVIMKHLKKPIPDMHTLNPQIPRGLCKVVERMMAKHPDDRFSSFTHIIGELEVIRANDAMFIGSEWTYCENCSVMAILKDDHCSVCNQRIGPVFREEALMSLKLVGIRDSMARKRLFRYFKATTKRPDATVKAILGKLPMLLSPRIPLKDAKTLHTKLHNLGAEVEMEKVGSKRIQIGNQRPALTISTKSISAPNGSPAIKQQARNSRKPMIVVLTLLLLATLVITYLLLSLNSQEPADLEQAKQVGQDSDRSDSVEISDRERTEKESETQEKKEEDRLDLEVFEHKSPSGHCHFFSIGISDKSVLVELGKTCEQMISRIMISTGAPRIEKPLKFDLDGEKAFSSMASTLGLSAQYDDERIQLHTDGFVGGDKQGQAIIASLLARENLRRISGGGLPRWLETGFALHMANVLIGNAYDGKKDMQKAKNYFSGNTWKKAFNKDHPRAYAQAVSFTDYLVDHYSYGALFRFSRLLGSGMETDAASSKVFHQKLDVLLKDWFIRCEH